MENQPNQPAKKGFVLLLGVIIGLLVGLLVAFVLVQKLDLKSPSEVKILPMPSTPAEKDTVYQYIVHQYDRIPEDEVVYLDSDSLSADSAFVEDYSMDYMLDDDDYLAYNNRKEETNVTSEKLVSKYEAPVLYFDANRNAVAAAANAPKLMEVQFWSTPFQNKIVYQFDGNVLKIKGLKPNEVYLIHYNKHYYLQNDKHVYQIQPSSEYMRLVEIHDVSFF